MVHHYLEEQNPEVRSVVMPHPEAQTELPMEPVEIQTQPPPPPTPMNTVPVPAIPLNKDAGCCPMPPPILPPLTGGGIEAGDMLMGMLCAFALGGVTGAVLSWSFSRGSVVCQA